MTFPRHAAAGSLFAAVLISASIASNGRAADAAPPSYASVTPVPGSRLVSPWNNVVVRARAPIDPTTVDEKRLSVVGDRSGRHAGRWFLSDDSRTLVFEPDRRFDLGESVRVTLERGLGTADGAPLPALSFGYSISATDPGSLDRRWIEKIREADGIARPGAPSVATSAAATRGAPSCDTLPPNYPELTRLASDHPESGCVFLSPFFGFPFGSGDLLILDELGMPVFHQHLPHDLTAFDFKKQPNGRLTYFRIAPSNDVANGFFALDASYAVVDSFRAGNGYETDLHDLQILPNGHALLMAYDPQYVDMSVVVPDGDPKAIVIGLILQELDLGKNVVFQWRSWDHFEITDMVESPGTRLTDPVVDYVHGNSIELDADGNLLLSSRHLNEITKIDRATGDILWRLGGNAKHDEFAFPNDPRGFSYQHDARRLPNGHLTLFDNGNQLDPRYSRALEYEVDEEHRTATLVWEYRSTPDTYGDFMGNVQRLPGGGSMIGWGASGPGQPRLTEIHADGSKAFELGLPINTLTYRAFRFPWETTRFATAPEVLDFGPTIVGHEVSLPLSIHNPASAELPITCFATTDPAFSVSDPVPMVVPVGGSAVATVHFGPAAEGAFEGTLYVRSATDGQLVARGVKVRGTGVPPPRLSVSNAIGLEGDAGTTDFAFSVVLSKAIGEPVTVAFSTADGSASLVDHDYVMTSLTVTIPAHETIATVVVPVVGDTQVEDTETFAVHLSNPVNATIDDGMGDGTIQDDDGAAAGVGDGVVTRFALGRVRPNPARASVRIAYALPWASRVRLTVLDLLGREVAVLVDGEIPAGRHDAAWSTDGRSGGVYFCRIQAGSFVATRRVALLE